MTVILDREREKEVEAVVATLELTAGLSPKS
jgi:hypothetical protein